MLIHSLLLLLTLWNQPLSNVSQSASVVEQSRFAVESVPIQAPAEIPPDILALLRKDTYVRTCLEEGDLEEKIRATWFVGANIHLSSSSESDLIVMPRELKQAPSENRCLLGANVGPFWIFKRVANGFPLVLELHTVGVTILKAQTNGYRDIQSEKILQAGAYISTERYKFNGHVYQVASSKVRPTSGSLISPDSGFPVANTFSLPSADLCSFPL